MTDEEVQKQLEDEAARRGVQYDNSDLEDVRRRDNSQEGLDMAFRKYDQRATNTPNQDEHAPSTPTAAWNANPQTQGRANSLYDELQKRIAAANGPVDPNDPIIHGQVAAFGANQERAKRDYLNNIAARAGGLGNVRGEQRMASEKLGQNISGYQSNLLAQELASRRADAQNALGLFSGQISGDQNRELQAALGFGDLDLRNRGLNQNNDQFLRELALRQWQAGDQSDYNWANL